MPAEIKMNYDLTIIILHVRCCTKACHLHGLCWFYYIIYLFSVYVFILYRRLLGAITSMLPLVLWSSLLNVLYLFNIYSVSYLFNISKFGTSVSCSHTMDILWEKLQWILPLYMEPISFQSKVSVVYSVTAAVFIDFCLKKLDVFSKHIGQKTNGYLNSTEQIPRNWNVDQLSMLITS